MDATAAGIQTNLFGVRRESALPAVPPEVDSRLAAHGIERFRASLPLTELHCMRAGDGPPLVIVPATISTLGAWIELVRFMSQRYTVYFFELPGHGGSAPFRGRYRSPLVAETVGHLLDAEGHERASVMGFSFGGILALSTVERLAERLDSAILLAPCATHRALTHAPAKLAFMRSLAGALRSEGAQSALLRALHTRPAAAAFAGLAGLVGQVENTTQLKDTLLALPASTLDVLVYEISEILGFEPPKTRYAMPLYFGMSRRDPLLDFDTTLAALEPMFAEVSVARWDFPYHQPPEPFTFEQLNSDFGDLLELTAGERLRSA